MSNKVMDDIIRVVTNLLQTSCGYCAAAIGDDFAQLNTTDPDGNDIEIKISVTKKEE